jgi:hypothetical protein
MGPTAGARYRDLFSKRTGKASGHLENGCPQHRRLKLFALLKINFQRVIREWRE